MSKDYLTFPLKRIFWMLEYHIVWKWILFANYVRNKNVFLDVMNILCITKLIIICNLWLVFCFEYWVPKYAILLCKHLYLKYFKLVARPVAIVCLSNEEDALFQSILKVAVVVHCIKNDRWAMLNKTKLKIIQDITYYSGFHL